MRMGSCRDNNTILLLSIISLSNCKKNDKLIDSLKKAAKM